MDFDRTLFRGLRAVVLVVLAVALPTASQAASGASKRNLQLATLNTHDGLSQDHVYDIVQDHRGFIWIATQEGLNRFDGYELKSYEHLDERDDTLSHDFVPVLMVDGDGVLWVGTVSGVNRYRWETDAFERAPFAGLEGASSLEDDHVLDLLEASDGSLWIATQDDGLVHVDRDGARVTRYRHDPDDPGSLPDDTVLALLEDSRGELWIGTQGAGLARFDAVAGRFISYAGTVDGGRGVAAGQVRALLEDRAGLIWAGTGTAGVVRFDPKRELFEQFVHDQSDPLSLGNDRVRDILEDAHGTLWLATDDGLSEWRPERRGFVNYVRDEDDAGSLPSNQVNALFADASGVLWIGTWNGVGKWNYLSDIFSYHDAASDQLPGDVVTSVAEDSKGSLWVGTYGTGLARVDLTSGDSEYYRSAPNDPGSLPDDRVMAVHVDSQDRVWVGTRMGGLARLDPRSGRFERFTHDPADDASLSANAVTSVLVDSSGALWVGTFGGGLNRGRADAPGAFEHLLFDPENPHSLSGNRVLTVFEDRSGDLWVGTDSDGLNHFDGVDAGFTRFTEFSTDTGSLMLETVTDVIEDRYGNLWLGTLGQGLLRWAPDRRAAQHADVDVFGKSDGLPTETIFGILEDQKGALWFSSNRGLTRFDPDQRSARQFDSRSGLRDNEFNQGASFRSRSGRLLFGSVAGLVSFFPGDLDVNRRSPAIVVTAHSRERELVRVASGEMDHHVVLDYLERFVSFDFVALDFTSPDKNQYRYRLDGFDEGWIEGDDYRRATYTNLPPGEFVFRVQASNNDGVWNRDGATIRVTVVPAPWNTGWAYLGYAALGGIALGLMLRSQRLKLRREAEQRELLEEQVQVRTEELASRNSELEELNSKLAEASVTDSLTGLRNRRYVDQFIASQVSLFERGQVHGVGADGSEREHERSETMFFMMIDLDGFKLINDRYGHHAGDLALLQVTELLQLTCRNSDTLVRWGGDEFMVIGFSTGFFGVKVLAQRIREAIADHRYELGNGQEGRLSASIGIAPYPLVEERDWFCSWELVAGVADQAAYIAKANGRNAWVSISGSENLSADMLEKLNFELPGLIEAGHMRLDSSISEELVLPGTVNAERVSAAG